MAERVKFAKGGMDIDDFYLLYLFPADCKNAYPVGPVEIITHERWCVRYRRIWFDYDTNQHWEISYDLPATENQEVDFNPYCTQVYPYLQTVYLCTPPEIQDD